MASYLQKLRRQSKQLIPQNEGKHQETAPQEPANAQEPPKIQEPATAAVTTPAGPSQATQTQQPPPPTVTEPSEEVAAEPVLDEEDQIFLERLAAIASEPEGEAPPLPSRPVEVTDDKGEKKVGRDAQEALMDGADKVALPMSPDATTETSDKGKEKAKGGLDRKKSVMSYFSLDRFKKGDGEKSKGKGSKDKTDKLSEKDKSKMADDLHAAAEGAKSSEQEEQLKENKELTEVLDQLNLSAVNNRVFSFSKESEALLGKFTQILKDIINGVPTAYNDLEKLFTDYDTQLKKMYGGLPPFLQNMVKSLPAKLTATLGPELLAANAEKPGFDAKAAGAGTKGKKSKIPGIPAIPSLKSLVTAQGAVATALKSIVNFLKFRFPMLATGTNLIMSLAVFLLLFVFWYCHKRGRETRLEKERLAAEEGESARVSSASSINEDNDSIFGDKPKRKPVGSGGPAAAMSTEQPTEPLIIRDDKAREDATAEAMAGLPSVSHLPDPKDGKAPVLGTTVEK